MAGLTRIAGMRGRIESLFEQADGEMGLDHGEARSRIGRRCGGRPLRHYAATAALARGETASQ